MPSSMYFQIRLGDLYIVNISCYIAKLPLITNIYLGDTNDKQQVITPTSADQGLSHRYQSVAHELQRVSTYGKIAIVQ